MRFLILIVCTFATVAANGNELFAFRPTASDIRTDGQQQTIDMTVTIDAIILRIFARSVGENRRIETIEVTATSRYNGATETIEIPASAYAEVMDPQFENLLIEADAGIYGHFHWIELPFGQRGRCFRPRRPLARYAAFTVAIDYNAGETEVSTRPPCAK